MVEPPLLERGLEMNPPGRWREASPCHSEKRCRDDFSLDPSSSGPSKEELVVGGRIEWDVIC